MHVRVLLVVALLGAPADADTCRVVKTAVSEARLEGSRVVVCFDRDPTKRRCLGLDLVRLVWEPLPATAIDVCGAMCRPMTPSSTITSSAVVTACARDGSACHTVATPLAVGLEAITNGALVAAVEEYRITVADVKTGMVTATIAPWPHPDNHRGWWFRNVRFVSPDRLVAQLGDGDTTLARVFTARAGAIALELPGGFDPAPPAWLGTELAFATAGSTELVVGDLKRGTRRSIPLFAKRGVLSLLATTPNKAIVAVQEDGDGTVAIVNGKAATLVPGPPLCP